MASEFVELKMPNGRHILVNLGLVVAFTEETDGNAGAVTLSGSTLKLGERYTELKTDMVQDAETDD